VRTGGERGGERAVSPTASFDGPNLPADRTKRAALNWERHWNPGSEFEPWGPVVLSDWLFKGSIAG
jgi:hypothetical protein